MAEKTPAALVIELAGMGKGDDEEMDGKVMAAEEIISFIKEEDAEGLAAALYDFIKMCMEEE